MRVNEPLCGTTIYEGFVSGSVVLMDIVSAATTSMGTTYMHF